jgi:ferric-dicitrate binding protein FerR (iron transport regulator)
MNQEITPMNEIKELIALYLTDELLEAERQMLTDWINKNLDNKKFFDEMTSSWHFAGTLKSSMEEESHPAFSKLEFRIKESLRAQEDNENESQGQKYKMLKRVLSVAATVLFAFLAGGFVTWFIMSGDRPLYLNPQTYQVVTPNGTHSELVLADGTKVWLNAGSTLTYTENYNIRSREVNLSGEAYFEVAKNTNKPFLVQSGGLQIKALGTAFNVKAYPDDKVLTATLIEGKIIVAGKSQKEGRFTYTLQPKQNIAIAKSKESVVKNVTAEEPSLVSSEKAVTPELENIALESNVNTILYTSWKDRRWVIERASFNDLAVMLERRYNVRIEFNPAEMEGISFTGIIENETLEQVIHILQLSAPLKYQFGKGEVTLGIDQTQLKKFNMIMSDKKPLN